MRTPAFSQVFPLLSTLLAAALLCACRGAPTGEIATPTSKAPEATALPTVAVTPVPEPTPVAKAVQVWDFTQGKALGWQATHGLSAFTFDEQGLHATTGADPYMVSARFKVKAADTFYFQVRMRSTSGSDAQLFWTTAQSPNYAEDKSVHFEVQADGEWHTYDVPLSDHPAWSGTITGLRLDPTAQQESELAVSRIALLGPRPGLLEVDTLSARQAVLRAGEPFEVRVRGRNAGDLDLAASTLTLHLPEGLEWTASEAEVALDTLPPRAEIEHTWQLRGPAGVYSLDLRSEEISLGQAFIVIEDREETVDTEWLENEHLRLSFPRQPYGYGVATLSLREGGAWRPVGRLRALGSLAYQAEYEAPTTRGLLYAADVERVKDGLNFSIVWAGPDGVTWSGETQLRLAPGARLVEVQSTLGASQDVQLINWTPLAFYAGDGASGPAKTSALLPGVEFLLGEERSSGTDFISAPANQRYVPHPYKSTVPLMSVSQDGATVGLMWDWQQQAGVGLPGALYAVPNTWEGQDNHLLALFVQSPAQLQENTVDASPPVPLPVGRGLQLNAEWFALPGEDALSPVALWLERYGLPDLPELPRSYDEGLRLSMDASTGVTWDEASQGWHYALHDPWGPGSSPANALHLWLAALRGEITTAEQENVRQLARAQAQRTDYAGGQPNPQLYLTALRLHLADDERGLLGTADLARPKLAGQNAEGYWPYQPQPREGRPFGEAGDTSSGQIAANALYLLRFARQTGDPALKEAGLRALDYLEAHHSRRPEGAQVWELPLHAPDLLAAAWAEQCYLEAYRLTGEARYAEQAQRWALSGLPFVYLWGSPHRSVMTYTTIPVFAATNYVYSWLGRPVMWNGLDYAFGLWSLNEALEDAGIEALADWRQVAEGITRAAMQMQPEEGEYAGMYPDAWDVVQGGEAYTWWLHPFYILQNLYQMQGAGAEVQTVLLRDPSGDVHVNAVAEIRRVERSRSQIKLELGYYAGETCAIMLNRVPAAPSEVRLDGRPLPEISTLAGQPEGWLYREGTLLIKLPFETEGAQVEVRF